MLLLHVFQMSFALGLTSRTSWSLPLKLWLNCPVVRQHVESAGFLRLHLRALRHSKEESSSAHANA